MWLDTGDMGRSEAGGEQTAAGVASFAHPGRARDGTGWGGLAGEEHSAAKYFQSYSRYMQQRHFYRQFARLYKISGAIRKVGRRPRKGGERERERKMQLHPWNIQVCLLLLCLH